MGASGFSGPTATDRSCPLSPAEAARWTRIGVLSALALLLGYLESFVPIPIPGVKLGLANIPILVALDEHDLRGAFFVGLTKVLAAGLLFGNPLTLAYSATGTLLSFVLMAALSLLPTMRLWMVSIVGALAHEAGQLLVAQLLLGTPLVWYGAPLLAVAGCVTGLLCGIAAERTASLLHDEMEVQPEEPRHGRDTRASGRIASKPASASHALLLLSSYLLFVVLVMHARRCGTLAACLATTAAACAAAHLQQRDIRIALAPTLPLALIALVAQLASNQQGTALLTLGPITLTEEALYAAATMLVRLASISCTSVVVVRLAGTDGLAAAGRQLLRPLQARGVRTQGPELAFSTALRLIALLADALPNMSEHRSYLTAAFWRDELPEMAQELYAQARQRHV